MDCDSIIRGFKSRRSPITWLKALNFYVFYMHNLLERFVPIQHRTSFVNFRHGVVVPLFNYLTHEL
jgi:hypothetical protein